MSVGNGIGLDHRQIFAILDDYYNLDDAIDLTELPDDEHFKVCYTNAEIVNRLLLSTTTHSGGTSTRQKCKELGLDSSKSVEFSFSTEE